MTKTPFVNKYGAIFFSESGESELRECAYQVVVKDNLLLCIYDKISGLYSFPAEKRLPIAENKTRQFVLHTAIEEDGKYFKETQTFNVFEVDDAQFDSPLLSWQLLEEIMVSRVPFDETQRKGFNNLLVRMEK